MLAISGLAIGVIGYMMYGIYGIHSIVYSDKFISKSWSVILHQNMGIIWALATGLWGWIMLDLAKDLDQLIYVEDLITTYTRKSVTSDSNTTKLLMTIY